MIPASRFGLVVGLLLLARAGAAQEGIWQQNFDLGKRHAKDRATRRGQANASAGPGHACRTRPRQRPQVKWGGHEVVPDAETKTALPR